MNTNYMQRIYLSLICLDILLLPGCDDFLSVTPDNRLELDSELKIQKVLVSAYPQASYWLWTEMASDNTDKNANKAYSAYVKEQEQMYRWEEVIGDDIDTPYDIWSKFYFSIETACAALEALDLMEEEGKITDRNLTEGLRAEALLCRAYGHFILVNLFSKTYDENTSRSDMGIPYIEEPDKVLLVTKERGTVQEVYEKIEKDIEAALPHIGKARQSIPKYHWSRESAYAFAAKFYLFYKKYDKAIEAADMTLGGNPSTKLRNWMVDGKKANNLDIAFNRYIDASQKANLLLLPAESMWGRIGGPYAVGKGYACQRITMNEMIRDYALIFGGFIHYQPRHLMSGSLSLVYKVNEYFEYYDKMAGIGWTHIVQVLFSADETLLIRAEANVLAGNLTEGLADLNIFTRGYTTYAKQTTEHKEELIKMYKDLDFYDPLVSGSPSPKKKINLPGLTEEQEYLLYPILHAKRLLTIHEGQRWFDINRYKIEIYRRTIFEGSTTVQDKLSVDDPRRVFQIPSQMIAAGIEPNPR